MDNNRLQAAFDVIQECGWMPDGITRDRVMPSVSMNQEPLTIKGRQRFRKMDWFATIGPRTTNFYQRGENGPENMIQVKTKDVEGIRKHATELANYRCSACLDTLAHPDDPTGQADCGYCGGSYRINAENSGEPND